MGWGGGGRAGGWMVLMMGSRGRCVWCWWGGELVVRAVVVRGGRGRVVDGDGGGGGGGGGDGDRG